MNSSERENQNRDVENPEGAVRSSGPDGTARTSADLESSPVETRVNQATAARRRFVTGRNLLNWWRDWGRTPLSLPPLAAPGTPRPSPDHSGLRPGFLSHVSKQGMACQWDVYLNHGQYPSGMEQALNALEQIEDWEQRLSYFRSESEISQVNRLAFDQPVIVSDALWQILDLAQGLWELTEGAFDLTSSSLSECWGFLKREGRMPNDQEVAVSLQSVGMDKILLGAEAQSVRFTHPETKINLGGIGKGWTLDQIAAQLTETEIHDFMFHAGQSSVLARGSVMSAAARTPSATAAQATSQPNASEQESEIAGWDVGVSHPLFPDRQLGLVRLCNQALGTSGSGRQFFHYRGQRLSHILDPRTGRPAQGVLSVTVLAPTAAQADALATACFVLGPDGCEQMVQKIPELAILLVVPDPRGGRVILLGEMEKYWQPH